MDANTYKGLITVAVVLIPLLILYVYLTVKHQRKIAGQIPAEGDASDSKVTEKGGERAMESTKSGKHS